MRGPRWCSSTATRRRVRPRRSRPFTRRFRSVTSRRGCERAIVGSLSGGDESPSYRAIASYHFAPTAISREHLWENVAPDDVIVTGNTYRRVLGTAQRPDLPTPPRWNGSTRTADDRHHRAPPREPPAHAGDMRSVPRDRRLPGSRSSIGPSSVAARCAGRPRRSIARRPGSSCVSTRSTMSRWLPRSKGPRSY